MEQRFAACCTRTIVRSSEEADIAESLCKVHGPPGRPTL